MSKDTVRTRSRIVIEKYRRGELVERREIENATLERVALKIAYLVYLHDTSMWDVSYVVNTLALGDYNKGAIKAILGGTINVRADTAARRYVIEVAWTDASSDEYIVYYVALHDAGTEIGVGSNIQAMALHFASLPSPLSKAVDDVIKYKWIIEIPYEVV